MRAIWAEANVRTVSLPQVGHALPIRHPDRLTRIQSSTPAATTKSLSGAK